MDDIIKEFTAFSENVLQSYIDKRKPFNQQDILPVTQILEYNSKLVSEFLEKGLNGTIADEANKIIEEYSGDKIEIKNKLESIASEIGVKCHSIFTS